MLNYNMAGYQLLSKTVDTNAFTTALILSHRLNFRKENCNLNAEIMLEVRNQRNGV